jgi:hypothetical protein
MESSANIEVNDDDDDDRVDQPHFNVPWFKDFPRCVYGEIMF